MIEMVRRIMVNVQKVKEEGRRYGSRSQKGVKRNGGKKSVCMCSGRGGGKEEEYSSEKRITGRERKFKDRMVRV